MFHFFLVFFKKCFLLAGKRTSTIVPGCPDVPYTKIYIVISRVPWSNIFGTENKLIYSSRPMFSSAGSSWLKAWWIVPHLEKNLNSKADNLQLKDCLLWSLIFFQISNLWSAAATFVIQCRVNGLGLRHYNF